MNSCALLQTNIDNFIKYATPQGPHSDILMMGGGGPTEVHINFIPKKIPTSEFVYPKISHTSSKLHLHYCWFELMKITIPKKIPVYFPWPKKSLSFIDPKKWSLLAKIWDPKKSLVPPPPPPPTLSVKYWVGLLGCYPVQQVPKSPKLHSLHYTTERH